LLLGKDNRWAHGGTAPPRFDFRFILPYKPKISN
jgi:hypothetical protein